VSEPFWPALVVSAALVPIAILRHSWLAMLTAAALSLAFSLLSLPDGWLLMLLPCIQMAMAVLLRWDVDGFGHVVPIAFVGTLVWLGETNRLAGVPSVLILGTMLGWIGLACLAVVARSLWLRR
jgi:hypothetical protein